MSRTSNAWGHAVAPVLEAEIQREEATKYPWRHRCRLGRQCKGRTAYIAFYTYVTGRRGFTSRREVTACVEHAERFAKRHELHWPPEAAPVTIYGDRIADIAFRGVRESLAARPSSGESET